MATFASSYIPGNGATATRNADVLPLPFPARPQAMTGYLRFVEMGTGLITNARLFQIGDASNSSPRLMVLATSNKYRLTHANDTSSVSATLVTALSVGDNVEMLVQLNVNGSVKIVSVVDGTTDESSTSAALVFASKWSGALLHLNQTGAGTQFGFVALRNFVFHRGVQSLATMRRLANVI